MPGTITMKQGKRVLEVKNYETGWELTKAFEELNQIAKEHHSNNEKNPLHFIVTPIIEEK